MNRNEKLSNYLKCAKSLKDLGFGFDFAFLAKQMGVNLDEFGLVPPSVVNNN